LHVGDGRDVPIGNIKSVNVCGIRNKVGHVSVIMLVSSIGPYSIRNKSLC
jgi:hypothetical protein